jgi:hypothetical protein
VIFLAAAGLAQSADEANWTTYNNPAAEFSVDFPGPNVALAYKLEKDDFSALYKMSYEKFYFFMFIDATESSSVYQDAKNYALAFAATEKDIDVGELKGKRYDFKTDDGFEHSFVAIGGKSFFYLFHVAGETRDESIFEKFLGSIKLTKLGEKSARDDARSSILKKPVTPMPAPAWTQEPGVLSGISTLPPPKYTKVTSGVAITSKPNPDYTELARRYNITGSVSLRVTFEKNAHIGEVRPLSKLPFGLTGSAMRAARRITFVPAMREGDPYEVAKVLIYPFNLY